MKPRVQLDLRPLSALCKALGDETRLRLVALLAHGELCVCHMEEALALTQPSISRHLAVLRAAGVVADRREGSWVYYRLVEQEDEERERLIRSLAQSFTRREAVKRDVAKLKRVRGPEACR